MAKDPARPRSEPLWQVPVFLLGLLALAGVWQVRPYWRPTAAERAGRDLLALRAALESQQTAPERLEGLVRALADSPAFDRTGAAGYLVGSGWVRLAEASDAPDDYWRKASEILPTVKPDAFDADEKRRWQHRLAKAQVHTALKDAAPDTVVDLLKLNLPAGEERAEGLRLIGEYSLRMVPPNEAKAREAYRDFLKAAPPRTRPALLNEARLQVGRISLRLNEADEAKKMLERVGPDAPPETYAAARTLLARAVLRDNDWAQALRYLEQARATKDVSPATLQQVRFELADVYLRANRREEAVQILTELKRLPGGPGRAAGIKLALLKGTADPNDAEALVVELENSAGEADPAGGYTAAELRDIADRTHAALLRDGRFEAAERLAKLYARFAPGRDRELLALTYRTWADAQPKIDDKKILWHRAAEQVSALVLSEGATPAQKREWLKQAVDLDLQAGDAKSALAHFDDLLRQLGPENADAALRLRKGQLHVAAGDLPGAIAAFEAGLRDPGNSALALRVELAECLNAERRYDEAKAQLELNVADPRLKTQENLRERTLFSLGDALFRLHDWARANDCFAEAVSYYADSDRAVFSRFYIGQCQWYIAGQELAANQREEAWLKEHAAEKAEAAYREREQKLAGGYRSYREHVANARRALQEVEAKLEPAEANSDSKRAAFWRVAAFQAAQCSMMLGEFEAAGQRFEKLAERFEGRIEQLVALGQLYECYRYREQPELARLTLVRLRTVYITLKDSAYDDTASNRNKKYWADWLNAHDPNR